MLDRDTPLRPGTVLGAGAQDLAGEVATEVKSFFRRLIAKLADAGLTPAKAGEALSTMTGALCAGECPGLSHRLRSRDQQSPGPVKGRLGPLSGTRQPPEFDRFGREAAHPVVPDARPLCLQNRTSLGRRKNPRSVVFRGAADSRSVVFRGAADYRG
jgi:hypothetical protein